MTITFANQRKQNELIIDFDYINASWGELAPGKRVLVGKSGMPMDPKGPGYKPVRLSVCLGRECIVAKRVGRSSWVFGTHLTLSNSNDVLGGCPNPFRGRASSCQSVVRGLPKLAKNMFRIDVQYLGNAAWYGVPIWNYSSSIGWRGHLWHSMTLKGQISLSSCYCALHFSIVPWGTMKKWRGTVKKFFQRCAPEIVPLHF